MYTVGVVTGVNGSGSLFIGALPPVILLYFVLIALAFLAYFYFWY